MQEGEGGRPPPLRPRTKDYAREQRVRMSGFGGVEGRGTVAKGHGGPPLLRLRMKAKGEQGER